MQDQIVISIIIPIYNGAGTLDQALTSIISAIGQENLQHVELILVNDGSQDETDAKVNAWQDGDQTWSLVYHREDVNRGLGNARNIGIKSASGAWLYLLDVDDELIANPLGIISRHPDSSCILCPRISAFA